MFSLKRNIDCSRRMAVYAIFDVLDRMESNYAQEIVGDIKAEVNGLGHTSAYAFAVTEESKNTSINHISLIHPAAELDDENKQLSVLYLMDSVFQHIDEVHAVQ